MPLISVFLVLCFKIDYKGSLQSGRGKTKENIDHLYNSEINAKEKIKVAPSILGKVFKVTSGTSTTNCGTFTTTKTCVQEMGSGEFGIKSFICLSLLSLVVWSSSYHPPHRSTTRQMDRIPRRHILCQFFLAKS